MKLTIPTIENVKSAKKAIKKYINITPLTHYPSLDKILDAEIWVKHENFQILGSFKVRGGLNYGTYLKKPDSSSVLVTPSTGNHGQSIAYSAKVFGYKSIIYCPLGINPSKIESMENLGAQVISEGNSYDESKYNAQKLAEKNGYTYVDGANEEKLIAGVATYSLEIFDKINDPDFLIVPLGAGSGASGACIVRDGLNKNTKVIAVQSSASPAGYLSWKEKQLIESQSNSKCEGLATGKGYELPQSILKNSLDDFILVEEKDIFLAMKLFLFNTKSLVESAGSSTLAAALNLKKKIKGKKVVLIASGGNASANNLIEALKL
ncbi:MAG: threonine ammonia-lyase [Chloroflexi bacterium]|nr:threonine ammonia-lyase [Chloroflexota bacterium]|tara:strand:+ start:1468 stop:2430 length:963 start_codon:yes stop_codon:yes gene_type:complete